MAHINRDQMKQLIESQSVISDFKDLDKQLTANGFDVRACALIEVKEAGRLAINKPDNLPPKLGRAFVLPGFETRLEGYDVEQLIPTEGFVEIEPNQPYFLISCERVNTPKNMMIHATHRTSLFRFTQSMMAFGFTEAGYEGYLTFMLVPFLKGSLELGARVAQISFSLLTGKANYEDQREFSHQGGKIF